MNTAKKINIQKGDLAHHKVGLDKESSRIVEKAGLVLKVNPVLGSGFQSADIMWLRDGSVETVMLNYLKHIQKK